MRTSELNTFSHDLDTSAARPALWRRLLAGWMALSLILHPALVYAADVVAAPGAAGPAVGQSANGTTVVNIVAPNGAGVSHNQYQQFNVGPGGVILNNGYQLNQTQQAGWIEGNPNLRNGSARIILNEVTGTQPSLLRGMTEVGGSRAEVIIANPNGISCNGCGFINTSRAGLVTGTPLFGGDGSLQAFRVTGGQLDISGNGLNANNIDQMDLLSRAIIINGQLQGKQLNLIAGSNQVDYASLSTQQIAGNGTAPQVAIDSSLLGGMYANKIRLVGTEAGVGVTLRGEMASRSDDIQISSNGTLTLNNKVSSAGGIQLKSQGMLSQYQTVYGQGAVQVQAGGQLQQNGLLAAGQSLQVQAASIDSRAQLVSGLQTDGRVQTGHNLTLNSTGQIRLQQGLTSGGNLQVNAGQLQVDGNVQSGGDLRLQSAQNLQIAGSLRSGGNLRLDSTGLTNLQQGLTSNGQLQLQAGQLQLGGNLYAAGDAALQVNGDLSNSVRLASGGNLQLQTANLNNTGMLAAGLRSDGTLGAQGQLILQVSNQVTQTGSLVAASDLNLAATQLNNQGVTYAAQDLHVEAGKLSNTAVLLSGRDTQLVVGELYNQLGGEIQAGRHLKVTGSNNARASVVLNDRARMEAQQGDVEIRATQFQNLGADPAAYRVSSPVSDQIQIAQHPNYANAISRAQGFYDYWLSYVPELVQYQHWLPYTGTDKRVQLKVDGYIEQLNPGFVAQPARLLAGHDLTLDVGTGSNRYSNIIAGNNIQLTGGSFTNTGLALTSDVTIQPIYEDGTAASNHWPGSHIYLAPLHHVKTQGSVSSIIGAGNTLTVSGLASFVNDNGLSQSAYVVTGSGNSSTPPTSLGGGVTLNNSGQLNVSGVSGNGLFILASSDNPRYLIEGNPLFTDKNRFLSSDYFLSSLGIDPQRMQKRLGDGAYEQQLVRNQLMQRTGKQYAFNTDANTDYRTLLDNAARFARSLQISPGIALTAAQLGRLTEDMVWMEERVVNGQRVLVPQLYLAGNVPTRLAPNGAVVMAKSLTLDVQQLQNSGAMVADSGLLVSANDLINRNGTLQAGGPLQLLARNDLQSQGGVLQGGQVQLAANRDVQLNGTQVQSEGALRIEAGRNLTLGTATEQYQAGGQQGQGHDETWSSSGTRQHVTQLASRGDLTLLAGQDLTLQGTQLSTTGNAQIAAGGDVTITAATETFQNHTEQHKKGFRRKTDEIRDTATETVIGSNIQVMGQLDIQSGKNLTISGSRVSAQQDLNVLAQQDVNITEQTERSSNHYEYHDKRSGFTIGFTGPTYSKSRTNLQQNGTSERVVSSELSGANINVQSGRDTTVRGSMLLADQDLTVQAGRNILIDAAHEQRTNDRHFDSKSSSIGITGFSKSMATQDGDGNGSTAVTSLLSANRGNLSLIAGGSGEVKGKGSVTTVGADLLAGQGILIDASNIDLLAAYSGDSSHSRSASKSQSLGISLTGYIGGPLNQILNNLEAARKGSGNSRLDTALALKAGYDSYKLATDQKKWDQYKEELKPKDSNTQGSDSTQGNQGGQGTNGQGGQQTNNNPGIGISVGFSNSKSSSSSDSSSSTAKGSNLQAQSIVLLARDTDIRTEGAKLQAKDIDLDAARNIELAAAVNQANVHSQNSSKGSSFGVTFGFGQQNGISFQIGGSKGKGLTDGSETRYDNTLITASNQLNLSSGKDTTLKGAQLAGKQVNLDVGGNLSLLTLQDRTDYQSHQSNSSWGISLCIPPICYGASSFSASLSRQDIDHNYQSAQGQTGIQAGQGGFNINVAQHTQLTGAAITSSAPASQNHLSTGSLGYSDLNNQQHTRASAESDSISLSFGPGAAGIGSQLIDNAKNNLISNLGSGKGLPENQDQQSQTLSVISPAQITLTGKDKASQQAASELTARDASTANSTLSNSLTLQQAAELEEQLKRNAQNAQAAQLVGSILANVVGDIAASQRKAYQDAELKKQDLESQLAQETDPQKRERLQQQIAQQEQTLKAEQSRYDQWQDGSPAKIALHALAGYLQDRIAGGKGTAGALAGAANEALTPMVSKFIEDALKDSDLSPKDRDLLKKSYMEAAATVIGQVTGGLAGGRDSAIVGGNVALNAEQNNRQLHVREMELIRQNRKAFLKYLQQMEAKGRAIFAGTDKMISETEAEFWMAQAARADVDEGFQIEAARSYSSATSLESRLYFAAKEFVLTLSNSNGYFVDERGQKQKYFTATPDDFKNGLKYTNAESPLFREFMATNYLEAFLPAKPTALDQKLYDETQKQRLKNTAKALVTGGALMLAGRIAFSRGGKPEITRDAPDLTAPRLTDDIPDTGEVIQLPHDKYINGVRFPAGSIVSQADGYTVVHQSNGVRTTWKPSGAKIVEAFSDAPPTPHKPIKELLENASAPYNSTGISQFARSWDKHVGRPGGTFEPLKGSIAEKNAYVIKWLSKLITDPKVVIKTLPRGGVEYRMPNGRGAVFEPSGKVNVLDPTWN